MQTLTTIEVSRLTECERAIERGLTTFIEVGSALTEIRDSELYRESHSSFETYCLERWNISRPRAYQLMEAASIAVSLSTMVDTPPPANERQIRELAEVEPELRAEVWQAVVDSAPEGKVTAQYVRETVQAFNNQRNGVCTCPICNKLYDGEKFTSCPYCAAKSFGVSSPIDLNPRHLPFKTDEVLADVPYRHVSDDSYEWYTPQEYIDAARSTMGGIDLDPASCVEANAKVKAKHIWTLEDNGIEQEWHGTVYLNPPYSYPAVEQFGQKLIAEYNAGNVSQAVVLVNNCTDAAWFHELANAASVMCFTKGRVKYWGPHSAQARQGQTFFYLGNKGATFKKNFAEFGLLVEVAS